MFYRNKQKFLSLSWGKGKKQEEAIDQQFLSELVLQLRKRDAEDS